jgi:hypothetical protein
METRFHYIPYYDLIKYRSSTSDKDFELDMETSPEMYEFYILDVFETASEAQAEESRLHNMFDVANNKMFFNKANSDFTLGSKYDGVLVYDLQEEKTICIENIKEFNIKHMCRIQNVVNHHNTTLVLGRFCSIDVIDIALVQYQLNNTKVSMYHKNSGKICFLYKDGQSIVGDHFSALYNGERRSSNGFFKYEQDYIDYIASLDCIIFYHIRYGRIQVRKSECSSVVGRNYLKLLNGSRKMANGYFLDENIYHRYSSTYTVKGSDGVTSILSYDEGFVKVGTNFNKLISGEHKTSNGYVLISQNRRKL